MEEAAAAALQGASLRRRCRGGLRPGFASACTGRVHVRSARVLPARLPAATPLATPSAAPRVRMRPALRPARLGGARAPLACARPPVRPRAPLRCSAPLAPACLGGWLDP